jgi:hypoxanthine phosphoribosyltransferase
MGMKKQVLESGIAEVLLSEREIKDRIAELGRELATDYKDKNPLLVALLKGAWVFLADITRAMKIPLEVDFMSVSSYGDGMQSTEVRILKDLDSHVVGRHVIIVEDIIDTGYTLAKIKEIFAGRGVASLKVCSFLDKPSRRKVDVRGEYIGFEVEDKFVVGYGLDFAQRYRALPYVGVASPENSEE